MCAPVRDDTAILHMAWVMLHAVQHLMEATEGHWCEEGEGSNTESGGSSCLSSDAMMAVQEGT